MFDEFVDNTERYEEFIEELLEANREGRFDDVFNRAYGMGTFSIDELIDIYARVDNDCVTNYRSKNESEEAVRGFAPCDPAILIGGKYLCHCI